MATENYDDPRAISEECVGELMVKELQKVDVLAPNASALHYSQGWALEKL